MNSPKLVAFTLMLMPCLPMVADPFGGGGATNGSYVLGTHGNGVFTVVKAAAAYYPAGGSPTLTPNVDFIGAYPGSPANSSATALTSMTAHPTTGIPKDSLSIQTRFEYDIGSAVLADSFLLELVAHASAETATVGGSPADGRIRGEWILQIGSLPGGPVSMWAFPNVLASGQPGDFSSRLVTYASGPTGTLIRTTNNISAGAVVTLDPAKSYEYTLLYDLTVLNGTDPDVHVSFNGSAGLAAVPELPTGWQMGLMALPCLWLVRKLRRS